MKILIIDDEYLARDSLKTQLMNLGYQYISEAENGKNGLQAISEESPELVFIDIQMPEMSGIEFMKIARTMYERMIFVVLSGYNLFEYAQKAIEYDTYKYLLKPVSDEALSGLMQEIEAKIQTETRKKKDYEELYRSDRKRKKILQSRFVCDLLHSTGLEREKILRVLEENGIVFEKPCFRIVLIHVKLSSADDEELLRFSFRNIAEEIWEKLQGVICFFEEENEIGFLINHDQNLNESVFDEDIKRMHDVMKMLGKEMHASQITVGVGKCKTGIENLEEVYDSANEAVQMSLVMGADKIYYAEQKKGDISEGKFRKEYWEGWFEKALLTGNRQDIAECVKALYSKFAEGTFINIKELHKLHIPRSLLLFALMAAVVILLLASNELIFIAPALVCLVSSYAFENALHKFMPEQNEDNGDWRYGFR